MTTQVVLTLEEYHALKEAADKWKRLGPLFNDQSADELVRDAERWRRDGVNLTNLGNWWHGLDSRKWDKWEDVVTDAELGRLVRQMPFRGNLTREETWHVSKGNTIYGDGTARTPEEALRALIGEPTE